MLFSLIDIDPLSQLISLANQVIFNLIFLLCLFPGMQHQHFILRLLFLKLQQLRINLIQLALKSLFSLPGQHQLLPLILLLDIKLLNIILQALNLLHLINSSMNWLIQQPLKLGDLELKIFLLLFLFGFLLLQSLNFFPSLSHTIIVLIHSLSLCL